MKLQIESTDMTTHINGVHVRLWKGTTEKGVPCNVFVYRIAVAEDYDVSQFDAEFKEEMPPTELAIPLRMIFEGCEEMS